MMLPASHSGPRGAGGKWKVSTPNPNSSAGNARPGEPAKPSPSSADGAHEREALPIAGFQGTPEEIERQCYERVYRGRGDRRRQLTWRAVLMGSVVGGVLSLTNLYIRLKAGWGFGVAITACILSYAIWTTLHRARIVRTPMTILENNCMQSTASSAGSSTGGTLISAFAAYMLITNSTLPLPAMLAWVFFLAVLGVTMAIPMKRQMINIEQLRFPSGIAAAETLRALHSVGHKGMRSARALGWAGLFALVGKFWADGLVLVSAKLAPFMIGTWMTTLNQRVFGPAWMGRTVMLSWEPMFIAAGETRTIPSPRSRRRRRGSSAARSSVSSGSRGSATSSSRCRTGRRRWRCSSRSRWRWSPAASRARPTPRRWARWGKSPSSRSES